VESPSPVPLPGRLVVKNGSKIRGCTSGAIPDPVSLIASDTQQESTQRPTLRIEHMTFAHQEQKHFLRDVFGDRFRPTHLQSEPVDVPLPPPVKKRQRLLISGQH